ncbi:Uma2 family endonuclease [Streptomyces gamaensis]|uniref:Uma2 family endonuclease n=1 Tax=Streptomyces gamaensis TaxID=1763542 RepID=A0ABW0YYB0_9ACTN
MTIDSSRKAERDERLSLDTLFHWLERMPVPGGHKVEVVEGAVHFWPQRDNHWDLTIAVYEQLRTRYPRRRLLSDVRVDFPGHLNGFCPDVVLLKDGAARGRLRYQDVLFVAEVITKNTARNDYGPKKDAYAAAGVPVYLVVDPYAAHCTVHAEPHNGSYCVWPAIGFGDPVDLTGTAVGLAIDTGDFEQE